MGPYDLVADMLLGQMNKPRLLDVLRLNANRAPNILAHEYYRQSGQGDVIVNPCHPSGAYGDAYFFQDFSPTCWR